MTPMKQSYYFTLFSIFLFISSINQTLATNYYVAPCNTSGTDGLTEATAFCALQTAADIVLPGDTVFIKVGTYLDVQLIMKNNGTAENPIVFIGYQTTIHDLPAAIPANYFKPDGSFVHDATTLPWLRGNNNAGTAITLGAYDFIKIKNLQISGYSRGIEGSSQYSSNVTIEHIYGTDFTNSGIEFYGSNYEIADCIIADASGNAFVSFGSNNKISRCQAYAINKKVAFYFSIRNLSTFGHYAIVENCRAEQIGAFTGATGFNIYKVHDTQIVGCVAKNISQNFRVYDDNDAANPANNNWFVNCLAEGENGFLIQNNAYNNHFINCTTEKSLSVVFQPGNNANSGKDNLFYNCIFRESPSTIKIAGSANQVQNNTFVNCTIDGNNIISGLFDTQVSSSNNHIINTIITGIKDFKAVTATTDPGFDFQNSLFYTIKSDSFLPTAYENNTLIFEDPLFFDCLKEERLQPNSPCIDKGIDPNTLNLGYLFDKDYWGITRPQGTSFDIGASEYDANYDPVGCTTQINYYVCECTNGQVSGDGLSIGAPFCSISEAALLARSGDTVFIKAGTYYEAVRPGVSGKPNKPIVYEGYQTTPGDNPNLNYKYGDNLDPTIVPVLDGIDTTGVGFDLEYMSHVTIRNLTLTRFQDGFYSANESYYLTLDNVGTLSIGSYSCGREGGEDICEEGCGDANLLTGGYSTIKNSFSTNAGAHNYFIFGDHNVMENCQSYGDAEYPNPTGYYIIFSGSYNLIKDCEIERIGEPCHSGHGVGVSNWGHDNVFINCTSTNTNKGFYVRGGNVHHNQFINCTSYDDVGYVIRDSAHHNQFISCVSKNDLLGVRFYDSSTFGNNGKAGTNNIFYNCLFEGTTGHIVDYLKSNYPGNPTEDNAFVNCVFDAKNNPHCELFQATETNINTVFINSIFKGLAGFDNIESTHPLDVSFYNCLFWENANNSTFVPMNFTNENPIYANPQFVSNTDYHLQSTSPAIDKGTEANLFNLGYNFNSGKDGNGRPLGGGQDIGIYEYPSAGCATFFNFLFDHDKDSTYQVLDSIYSQISINTGYQIIYQAAKTIHLLPGFHAKTGSDFTAIIDDMDCDVAPLQMTPPRNKLSAIDQILSPLKVYPNPFKISTNLSFHLAKVDQVSLTIYSMTGKIMNAFEQRAIKPAGTHTYHLSTSKLENGMYIVVYETTEKIYTQKIIVSN